MKRVIAGVIAAALAVVGVIALIGAVETLRAGAEPAAIAQGILAPLTLFVFAGIVVWIGFQPSRRR